MRPGVAVVCFVAWIPLLVGCEASTPPAEPAPRQAPAQAVGDGKLSLEMALIEGTGEDPMSPGRLQVTLKNETPEAFTFEEPGPIVQESGREPATRVGLVVAASSSAPDSMGAVLTAHSALGLRSEERRVGKECRSGGSG